MKKLSKCVFAFLTFLILFSCAKTNQQKFIPEWINSSTWYSYYNEDYDLHTASDRFYAKLKNDTLYYSISSLDTSIIQIINFEKDSSYYYLTERSDTNISNLERNTIKRYPYSCLSVKNKICLKLGYDDITLDLKADEFNNLKNTPLFFNDTYFFTNDIKSEHLKCQNEFIQIKFHGYSVGDTIRNWSNIDNHYSYCYLEENYSNLARFDLYNDSIIYEITGFDIERSELNNIIAAINKKYSYAQSPTIDTIYNNSKPYMRHYSWNDGNVELGEWINNNFLEGWSLWIYDYPVRYYLSTIDLINRVSAKNNIIQ